MAGRVGSDERREEGAQGASPRASIVSGVGESAFVVSLVKPTSTVPESESAGTSLEKVPKSIRSLK